MPFNTLGEMIIERKKEDKKGITFILGSNKEIRLSYGELYNVSLQLLYNLQCRGFKKDDKVIFQIDDNRLFVFSFWACVLGGMIPVPVTTGSTEENSSKIYKIWDILDKPKMIFTSGNLLPLKTFAEKSNEVKRFNKIKTAAFCVNDSFSKEHLGEIIPTTKDDIAFIQFSSGSTGEPKGVILTHSNVITNMNSIKRFSKITSADVSLTWMPLTHDMGLIGGHIKDILIDIDQYNMETNLFITNPVLWIEKVSEHKASLLYSPNFGYKHFLEYYSDSNEKIKDLSAVRIIYNGAEPISLGLCDNFIAALSKYGLKRTTMQPVYGLAEATVAVSFPHPGDDKIYHTVDRRRLAIGEEVEFLEDKSESAVTFMDVGYPIYSFNMRICDEDENVLSEDHIGYIEISGGSITRGYFNNQNATKQLFTSDGWLITGDLGFMHNKRLTITGRAKDVIFVAGQNFYAQDIERIVEETDTKIKKSAAVGVFNSKTAKDELIVFIETDDDAKQFVTVAETVKKSIAEKLNVETAHVIPIKEMLKTESGKLKRYKLAESFASGDFDTICGSIDAALKENGSAREFITPYNNTQTKVAEIWCELLKQKRVSVNDNFFELGGDSIKITQLVSRINDFYATDLAITDIYENQTVEAIAKLVDNYSQSTAKKEAAVTMVKSRENQIQLTYGQESLWFINSLKGESTQYNLFTTLRLYGELDRKALEKSINTVVMRHEALHMEITEQNGKPIGKIADAIKLKLEYIDLTKKQDVTLAAAEFEKEFAKRPFILSQAPLIRAALAKVSPNEYRLTLAVHHIVFDGWSFSVLMKELADCYKKYTGESDLKLKKVNKDYSDFAMWQKEWIKSEAASSQLNYWKKTLSGAPELDFPTDHRRPVSLSYKGKKYNAEVSKSIMPGLRKVGARANATLFMTLFAAFNILLYKYTGKTDIVVGTPIANRNKKDCENIIGLLTNNLVLRTVFSENNSFEDILKTIRKNTLKAYDNQDIPFEKIVNELNCERDMSKNPLFQIFFALQNTPNAEMNLGNVKAQRVDFDAGTSRFDLSLDITEKKNGLSLCFEYSTDLFNDSTIERFAKEYKQLLSKISVSADFKANDIEILTHEEIESLSSINNTKKNYDATSCWTELFENQVASTPNAVAVEAADEKLTYKELDEQTSQLANYLVSLGIGKESVVGVYLDRSVNMLESLIAIHKAGAAYLPMDPIFPKDRLGFMLDDANASYIISDSKAVKSLPENSAQVIFIDKIKDTLKMFDTKSPKVSDVGDNLAYLIYTSGSTGKPKGVEIEHHSLKNFLISMRETTGIKNGDALLAVTTLSFDIAALELYLPLISGAKVVIATREDAVDGEKLASLIDEKSISFFQATPATFRLLLEADFEGSDKLTVLCGGEAYERELADKMLLRCKRFINVYGPTETTVWSTLDEIKPDGDKIHIGKPIANTTVYVLDNNLKRVPIGVEGELYIGGLGVARGYRNLPKLTDEKFMADPFSDCGRMYKTGDIVKLTAECKLLYISRKDNQVKIRGYRIELGEIETLINTLEGVKQCVVIDKLLNGNKAIVAYIKPSKQNLNVTSLRASLKEKLPGYMLPSAFACVDEFPLTPNGKINKRALADLEVNTTTRSNDSINDIEKAITSVWQSVLTTGDFDRNSSFFDVGGNSLLMAQVRSKLKKLLGREISMMELFRYPTVKTLAEFLSGEERHIETYEEAKPNKKQNDIAVIGMSARFPGASNIDEFWKNLCEGKECISRFNDNELHESGVNEDVYNKKNYVKAWGVINDEYKFDAAFIGYNPTEALTIDPQQRVFLEEAYKALENSGCDTSRFKRPIGIFASVGMNTYASKLRAVSTNSGISSDYQIMTGNEKDFIATRTAYKLGFEGPSATVQTACSSSMTAVHLACHCLINSECDMAFAGGVSIKLPQKQGYLYEDGMILSPDGHCRAFDSEARGTVGGNGAGVVVLKRLDDALKDKDNILAVIKGTGISNDGSNKIGFTAPSAAGEAKAEKMALKASNIAPETVGYIETHGTGTPLGDPIEIEALNEVYSKATNQKAFCALGSVKPNIGHLDAASGIAGFIKTVLILNKKQIPPSINFSEPNPKAKLDDSAFFVNTTLKDWQKADYPRRAAISSFGIGGTNVHAILEEAPQKADSRSEDKESLLVFSAKDKKALDKVASDFDTFLKNHLQSNLADIAFTLQTGRKAYRYRRFFVASSISDAIKVLTDEDMFSARVHDSDINLTQNHEKIENPCDYTLENLGNLWLSGAEIAFQKLYENTGVTKVILPNYPFNGEIFKVDDAVKTNTNQTKAKGKIEDIDKWFYYPVFEQSAQDTAKAHNDKETFTVIFCLLNAPCQSFIKRAASLGLDFVTVTDAKEFAEESPFSYKMDFDSTEHYNKIFQSLNIGDYKNLRLINLFGLTGDQNLMVGNSSRYGKKLFFTTLELARNAAVSAPDAAISIKVVTDGAFKIFAEPICCPEKALAVGTVKVIPIEYKKISCEMIDIEGRQSDKQEELLINEAFESNKSGITALRFNKRFVQVFKNTQLQDNLDNGLSLRKGGVYIITGGLGGIGLNLAKYIAENAAAKLVLVSHSDFPDENMWNEWLITHESTDPTTNKIDALSEIKKLGSEVLILKGDVTDIDDMSRVREQALAKFGCVDGIICASGAPGGGMIATKTKEAADKVFAAKVDGTKTVYKAFKDTEAQFMILVSSINAITGGFGQSDYCGANAYLDEFANSFDSDEMRIVAINFDRWPGVGIAKDKGKSTHVVNPIVGKKLSEKGNTIVFENTLSPEKDFVLSEHLIADIPTVAGTTYIEMSRAAFTEITGESAVLIKNVAFFKPLAVEFGEQRKVYTLLTKKNDGYEFTVVSKKTNEATNHFIEHAKGFISEAVNTKKVKTDISELKAKTNETTVFSKSRGQKVSEEFISFGGRWRSLDEYTVSQKERLAHAVLSNEFAADFKNNILLHPALLDVATGTLRLTTKGNYLPFSYKSLTMYKPLAEEIYSHIIFDESDGQSSDMISCNVEIFDKEGELLVDVVGFTMKKVSDEARLNTQTDTGKHDYSYLLNTDNGFLNIGLTEAEGREVFGRVINGCNRSQIIVSVRNIDEAIRNADYTKENVAETVTRTAALHSRPEIDTAFAAPRSELETNLCDLWQEVLSIDRVGISDEFFDLGGDSLLLISLHTKLCERFNNDIAIVDLYKYNTVAKLAKYLSGSEDVKEEPKFENVNSRADKQLEMLRKKKMNVQRRR